MKLYFMVLVCTLLCAPAASYAQARRFALIAGNNHGLSSDITLHHAVSDAERVSSVLAELGNFAPENILLLRDASADSFRQALAAMFERIKLQAPNQSSLLFLYYSGHADAQDLHLRDSRFALSELGQLARAAPTSVRLVILDACQSGALTRVKGGRVQQAFALPDERELGAGEVFLTASASSEDAQESDELRGSFLRTRSSRRCWERRTMITTARSHWKKRTATRTNPLCGPRAARAAARNTLRTTTIYAARAT